MEVSKTMTKHDPRKLTKFYEITRTNLVLTSCGFVDRRLSSLFQQPARFIDDGNCEVSDAAPGQQHTWASQLVLSVTVHTPLRRLRFWISLQRSFMTRDTAKVVGGIVSQLT